MRCLAAATLAALWVIAGASAGASAGAQQSTAQPPQPAPRAATVGDKLYEFSSLHTIHLSLSASEWAVLQTSNPRGGIGPSGTDTRQADGRIVHTGSGFGGFFPWAHADLRADDLAFKDVGLRYKGNFSFTSTSAAAPLFASFKMKIDVYTGKGTWDGEKTFNLSAGVLDPSKMKEALAFAIFRSAGVPAPRTAYAQLRFTVPGIYQDTPAGLFTMIEDVNARFLARALPPGTGLLMKPEGTRGGVLSQGDTWASYVPKFRPDRDATPHEQARVMAFANLITQTDVALFRAKIGTFLDVDEFLRFISVNAFIANTDSYLTGGHNYYLYLDPRDDMFRFMPWDEDLSMGPRPGAVNNGNVANGPDIMRPNGGGDQPLIYWLLDDPAVMTRYKTIIRELSTTAFSKASLGKMIDAIEQVSGSRATTPRAFLDGRAAYVEQLVSSWEKH
jgi:hypothetical protein